VSKQSTEISKFLSYILRHEPDSIGMVLDREGWADISENGVWLAEAVPAQFIAE